MTFLHKDRGIKKAMSSFNCLSAHFSFDISSLISCLFASDMQIMIKIRVFTPI